MKALGQNGHGAQVSSSVTLGNYASQLAGPPAPRKLDTERLTSWLRDHTDARQKANLCAVFTLNHDPDDGKGPTTITHIPVPKKATPEEIESLIEKIAEQFDLFSSDFAATFPRVQRFLVGGHVTDNVDTDARFIFPFLVSPPPEVSSSFHQQDGPETNVAAVVGHLQRILDRVMGLHSSGMQAGMDRLVEQQRDLLKYNDALMQKNFEYAQRAELLLDAHAARQIQVEEARANLEIKKQLINGLLTYGVGFVKAMVDNRESRVLGGIRSLDQNELLGLMLSVDSLPDEKRKKFTPVFITVLSELPPDRLLELTRMVEKLPDDKKAFFEPIFKTVFSELSQEKAVALNALIQQKLAERSSEQTEKKE